MADVITRIRARNEVKQGIRDAEGSIKGFARRTAGLFRKLLGPVGLLAGGAGIGFLTKQLFEAGSTALETESKFRTVFGESQGIVSSFNENFAQLAGISRTNLQEVTATTGAIVQGLGFAQEASAQFSTEVVQLAGDLGSFNNLPTAQVARAIQSALTGEREQLKRLGIVLRQTDVDQRALTLSGKEATSALTDQERATATLQLITERAGTAVGDLARTQNSAANVMRRIIAAAQDLWQVLGEVFTTALSGSDEFKGFDQVIRDFTASIRENFGTWVKWTRVVFQAIGTVGRLVAVGFRGIKNTIEIVIDAIQQNWFNWVAGIQKDLNTYVIEPLNLVIRGLNKVGFAIEELNTLPFEENLAKAAEQGRQLNQNMLELADAGDQARAAIKALIDEINREAPSAPESTALGAAEQRVRRINELAAGAQVTPAPTEGPELTGGMIGVTPELVPEGQEERLSSVSSALLDFRIALFETLQPMLEMENTSFRIGTIFGELAGNLIPNLGAAFSDAFAAVGEGANVFSAVANAAKKAIGETAAAEGRVEFARGVAKIAAGIFPPNPAAFASAAQHFAAGALLTTIGGALGGGGAARPGRGAGGGAGGNLGGELRRRNDPFAERPSVVVQFPRGPQLLDPTDAQQAEAFKKMFEELTGTDAIVEVV